MKTIINHLEYLSTLTQEIKLYKEFGPKLILHHCGKIVEEIDNQYIEFLKNTNGAYILGYTFLGIKNRALSENVYDFMRTLYDDNFILCSQFWGVARTKNGLIFGYLKIKDKNGNHYIGYYDPMKLDEVYIISSSFNIFINKFLDSIENELTINPNIKYLNANWFFNPDIKKLSLTDSELYEFINKNNNGSLIYKL